MLIEFIIRGGPDNDFDLHTGQWREALRPVEAAVRHSPGFAQDNIDIEVDGVKISFSPEPPGWQVVVYDPPDAEWASRVAESICRNMSQVSGHDGTVVSI
ncbi:MAG TPA: hypothetical protein VGR35_20495 [Tepidisphaeraceae bacterium]|nr:hypothetical protein [Tepidisphaeraceae bacterium]